MEYEFLPQFNLRYLTEVTEEQLDGYLYVQEQKTYKDIPLVGLGWIIVACAKQFRINPIFILALMIHESGWGRSRMAREKNNLTGWRAYDKGPWKWSKKFPTKAGCVIKTCEFLDKHYLTKGGKYYHGGTIRAVNKEYARDPNWGQGICRIMNQIGNFVDAKTFEPEAPGC